MRHSFKLGLAAVVLAVTTAAQAAYTPGDLLIGFDGGTQNLIYDLGQMSSFTPGQTWTISPPSGTTRFGLVGYDNANNIYATWTGNATALGNIAFDPTGTYSTAGGSIRTIAGGASAIQAGQSRTTTSSDTTGWYMQTDQPAGTAGPTYFFNTYGINPNVGLSATAYLIAGNNNGTLSDVGSFGFNGANGLLTFAPVPEPTIFSLVGGSALLALTLRRRLMNA